MYFRGLIAASDKIVLQKKKTFPLNEFRGMMDRSAEYVLDYIQIKKKGKRHSVHY